MTGPSNAAELLALASQQLSQLTARTGTEQAPTPAELAAAWPAFHRAGQHLLLTVTRTPDPHLITARDTARTRAGLGVASVGTATGCSDTIAEPQLSRAADLLSAAADLMAGRDRSMLTRAHRNADAALASAPLLAGAYLVADATLREPAHVAMAVSAVTAIRDWSRLAPLPAPAAVAVVAAEDAATSPTRGHGGTFHDAHTLPTPSRSSSPSAAPLRSPAVAGARQDLRQGRVLEVDFPELIAAAVHDWQQAAVTAGQLPTPSSLDLRGTALAAGTLLALSHLLLLAYPNQGEHLTYAHGPKPLRDEVIARIQHAGHGWNMAADWGQLTTGTAADSALVTATGHLDQAISVYARRNGRWDHPEQIAVRAESGQALVTVRGALAAIQTLAEQHNRAVRRLVNTGGVYGPAGQLTPTMERVSDRLAHRWVPINKTEGRALTDTYSELAALTSAVRISYTQLTNPRLPHPHGRQQHSQNQTTELQTPEIQTTERQATPPRPAVAPPRRRASPAPVATAAGQRWQQTCQQLDPRLVDDSHWPALAGALDRVELAGVNVTATLIQVVSVEALPDQHPARELHYRLVQLSSAAAAPYTSAPALTLPPSRPHCPPMPAPAPPVQAPACLAPAPVHGPRR